MEAVLYRYRTGIPNQRLARKIPRLTRKSILVLVVGVVQGYGCIVFQAKAEDADNEYDMIDATIVCAHTRSARAKNCSAEQEDIGRSKGGFRTKIHGVVDALGNPTNFF